MCALLHVLQSDDEPTGVPPLMGSLPMTDFFLTRIFGMVFIGRELSRPGNEAKTEIGALPIELHELPLATGLEPATSSATGKYLFSTPPAYLESYVLTICQGTCEASFRACAVRDLVFRDYATVPRDHCPGRVSRPACRLAVELTCF